MTNNICLLVEFTDICNLKCIMCDHGRGLKAHGEHPPGIMEEKLFDRIISCLKDTSIHIGCFHEGWMGESLCHKQFVKFSKKLFEANNIGNFFENYSINTNGLLFNKEV